MNLMQAPSQSHPPEDSVYQGNGNDVVATRMVMTFLLGLLLAHFGMSWVESKGLIPENFPSLKAYDNTLTLVTFAMYPLAWVSAAALIGRLIPYRKTD
jgi:hypothetical protein